MAKLTSTTKTMSVEKATKLAIKNSTRETFITALESQGLEVISLPKGIKGKPEGTLIIKGADCDLQVQLITPASGEYRYEFED